MGQRNGCPLPAIENRRVFLLVIFRGMKLQKIIDLSITPRRVAIVGQTTNQMKSMNDITLVTLCSAPASLAPDTIVTLVALDA